MVLRSDTIETIKEQCVEELARLSSSEDDDKFDKFFMQLEIAGLGKNLTEPSPKLIEASASQCQLSMNAHLPAAYRPLLLVPVLLLYVSASAGGRQTHQ